MPKLKPTPTTNKPAAPALPMDVEIYGLGTVQRLRDDLWSLAKAVDEGRESYYDLADKVDDLVSSVDSLTTAINSLSESITEWRDEVKRNRGE